MKRTLLATLLASAIVAPVLAAGEDHKPKYGGVVVETKVADLELVAKPEQIVIYAGEHGKPLALTSASGKVTVFNGAESKEAPVTLANGKMEAKGPFKIGAGTKVLAEVAINGKPPVAARFSLK
jgi:hypothetical protein